MQKGFQIPLFDMVMCLSSAIDLVSPAVTDHHKRVSYVASMLAGEVGLPDGEIVDLIMAGALHDIGGLTLKDRLDALTFEVESPHIHSELGYRHLSNLKQLGPVTDLVRFHHVRWDGGRGRESGGRDVPYGSHLLHIADRVDALINRRKPIGSQVEFIRGMIMNESDKMFMPELVRAFDALSGDERFWEGAFSNEMTERLSERAEGARFKLDLDGLHEVAITFAHIIDFRSRYTSIHSGGVAATASVLGALCGMHMIDQEKIRVAGLLHDLGKLAVPAEILNKPDKLTTDEFQLILVHPYFTHMVLRNIHELHDINAWASHHHERMDGNGYPFNHCCDDLSLGCRIMAVADVFTAITEDRPYRRGMDPEMVIEVMGEMAGNGGLDPEIVNVMMANFDELDLVRKNAQASSRVLFQEFLAGFEQDIEGSA